MSLPDYDIGNLDINPTIILALRRANLTNQKRILSLSVPDIERLAGLSTNQILSLKNALSLKFIPVQKCKAIDIINGTAHKSLLRWKLSTTCPVIDRKLKGGLLSGFLIEIAGESACGKTQLCLQTCIGAQLQGKGAVYICTEDVFPSRRLQQMIRHHSKNSDRKHLGNGIFIEHVSDFDTLDFCVTKRLPTLLNRSDASVVIIDSVAALFRCHYDSTQAVERAEHLIRFASALHNLASEYNIPIICVNQVTSNIQSSSMSGLGNLVPSLGIAWANQVQCRIMMSRLTNSTADIEEFKQRFHRQSTSAEPTFRRLRVVFAPHLPPSEISVYIDNDGIHGIDEAKLS